MQRINCGSCYCAPAGVMCGGCSIPPATLTVSWTGVGGAALGSTTLTFNGVDAWTSGCADGVTYRLSCTGGARSFSATAYTGAPCPGGTPIACSTSGGLGSSLLFKTIQCSPLLIQYDTFEPVPFSPPRIYCNNLYSLGYRSITITL